MLKPEIKLTPQNIRDSLHRMGKELMEDTKLDTLCDRDFDVAYVSSKWINKKRSMVMYMMHNSEVMEEYRAYKYEEMDNLSDIRLSDSKKETRLLKDKVFRDLIACDKLLNFAIDMCDDARDAVGKKGFAVKHKLDWLKWNSGVGN